MSQSVAFSYDPFDPEVMANPLPYYRILRDRYPAYYMPQWDTFALSRFEDIWQVLEVNDGTFVATEGTLPPASVLAQHNDGPLDDPPLHPLPFHAVFDTDLYAEIRRAHSQPLRPRSVAGLEARIRTLANERLDAVAAAGFLRPDSGVRGHRRGFDGVRITGSARRSRTTSVGRGQCRQPGRARRGRRHRASPAQLP